MSQVDTTAEKNQQRSLLARNFGVLMASQLSTWALSMVATIAIPRYLGAELVGRFHLVNSLWAIGMVVLGFGMDLAVTKRVARDSSRAGPLLAASVAARMLLAVPVVVALFTYARLIDYSDDVLLLMVVVGIGNVALFSSSSVTAVLQGLDRMAALSIGAIVGRFVFVGGALILLAFGYSIIAVAIIAGVGHLAMLIAQLLGLRRARADTGDSVPIRTDFQAVRDLLGDSFPYFWISFFVVLYLQADAVVISWVVEREEVLGWYSAYDRLAGTLLFVPTIFKTAVYPTLSRVYERPAHREGEVAQVDTSAGHGLTRKTFELMMLTSVPAGFGVAVVSRPLVELLFGSDFINAAPVVAVGGIVILLTYLNSVLGIFLISMDRQRQWTRFIALAVVLTVLLDLMLVPFFQARLNNGAIGGAVAYLITEAMMLGGAIYLLPRGAIGMASLKFALRVVFAGLVMVAGTIPLLRVNLIVAVGGGAVIYLLMVVALRLIDPETKQLVVSLVPGKLQRRIQSR